MKKILYSLIAVLAMVMSSCSNDDIEIVKTGEVSYTVLTQNLYDSFGTTNSLKEKFLAENVKVGIFTFIYDGNGDLVSSDSVYSKTFGQIQQNFTLHEGKYTAMTIEMMVDEDLGNVSESWVIVGKDKLSTLEIRQRIAQAYWYSAIGSIATTFDVSNTNSSQLVVAPNPIGTIVNMRALRFDNTEDYDCVYFTTKDQPVGRFLSPKYIGAERFHYEDYTAENTWCIRGYQLKQPTLSYNVGLDVYLLEEGRVHCSMEPSHSVEKDGQLQFGSWPYGFPSDNFYYDFKDGRTYYAGLAFVGGGGSNECVAKIFEDKSTYNKWVLNLPSITSPKDIEPYLEWGASASVVNSYMVNGGMKFIGKGTNKDNSIYYAAYSNSKETLNYEYRFDISQTNLSNLLMTYSSTAYSFNDILSKLKQKFNYKGYNESLGGYYLESNTTIALMIYGEDTFKVLYVDNRSSNSKSLRRSLKRLI